MYITTEFVYFMNNKQRMRILSDANKKHFMNTFYKQFNVFTEGKSHSQIQ